MEVTIIKTFKHNEETLDIRLVEIDGKYHLAVFHNNLRFNNKEYYVSKETVNDYQRTNTISENPLAELIKIAETDITGGNNL
jgi:hypothetical protein